MLIDGEKYACEACVRGHRVSSCTHSDRPLLHVNKKGRPVSQCQHCRGMRKTKSQHVHCECQQKGHSKDHCPHQTSDGKQEPNTCCCQHTSKCTCAHKKDHLQNVHEDIPQVIQPKDQARARTPNHNSHDSKPTVFSNGHHKPVHKFNDAHHHYGMPYSLDHHKSPPKPHALHNYKELAQRSSDSLPLSRPSKPHHESPLHVSMTPDQTRQVKSEHNSPRLGPTTMPANPIAGGFLMPAFDPTEYAYSPFPSAPSTQPANQFDFSNMEFDPSWFVSYGEAQQRGPPNGISLLNMDSSDNLLLNHAALSQTRPAGLSSLDPSTHLQQPVNPLSGDLSEPEDFSMVTRESVPRTGSTVDSTGVSSPEGALTPDHRLSSASSYYGSPKGATFPGNTVSDYDIDEVLRQTEAETRKMQLQNQQSPFQSGPQTPTIDSRADEMPMPMVSNTSQPNNFDVSRMYPFTVHEAQARAHSQTMAGGAQNQMAVLQNTAVNDPAWSLAPDMSNPELSLDDAQEDEDWVR